MVAEAVARLGVITIQYHPIKLKTGLTSDRHCLKALISQPPLEERGCEGIRAQLLSL